MDKELLSKQKEIDNLISKRSNLTTVVIVIAGGTLGLAISTISLNSIIKLSLLFIGTFAFLIFLKGLLNTEELIDKLIKELRK